VIGSTEARSGAITNRMVRPADLAATVFRHLDITLDALGNNLQGRPVAMVTEGGVADPGAGLTHALPR
jgi:hypothetical protein